MDGYELTASIVNSIVSLSWPAAIIGCVWSFRRELAALIPLLHVKHKDWEISFRLSQAEMKAAQLPAPPQSPEDLPTPEEKSKFEQVADVSPRAAILEVRAEIEETVRSLAEAAGLLTPKVQSTLGLTRLLRSNGFISPQTSSILDDLRVLGNNAAHNPNSTFSKEEALRFRALADRAISQLCQRMEKLKTLK